VEPHPAAPQPTSQQSFDSMRSDLQRKLQELYRFELMPKTFLVKFRQRVEGFQIGANFEFNGVQVNGCSTKFVFKPATASGMWKVVCEPKHGDLRLLTKKIPIGPLFHLQMGIGHDFHSHSTGWKWKVTSAIGSSGLPEVHQKTTLPIFPGFDIAVGWTAHYEPPEVHGALNTGEPAVEMNLGRLHGSIERVAAIYTHVG